ncbi:hypothetical protein AM1_1715 [Acaryochloris marina MBIC11017]|uniref:Uncharacterized protein n=1 Tax=Acaryochloris marina (strain MBIC 11017) TaxID=329726 RepID=B0CB97_ACAM1|nr:hypothetical protein AM1_1715 [Acaryochloris marina MBIC11017]
MLASIPRDSAQDMLAAGSKNDGQYRFKCDWLLTPIYFVGG